jgi:hypothetical protein
MVGCLWLVVNICELFPDYRTRTQVCHLIPWRGWYPAGMRQVLPTSVVFHCAFAASDCERSAFAGQPAQSLCAQPKALDPSPGAILTQILPVAGQLAWPNVDVVSESLVCMMCCCWGSRVPMSSCHRPTAGSPQGFRHPDLHHGPC